MDDRSNTIAGWVLFGGICALGFSVVSGKYFHSERPEKMGYVIEGVETASAGPAEVDMGTLMAAADVTAGEAVFKKCTACHSINQGGANGIGPNLYAVMGEKIAAARGGYAFSEVLSGKGGIWDFNTMNAWLESPRKFAAGTKMTFAGLGDAKDRANVIAYMNAQGSNLPLPAPAAAPAADAAAADGAAAAADGAADAPAPAAEAPTAAPAT
ncbi:MAG: cytochrome c family protein [Parasphingorhabdus sp.]|nr:cytochrome c family protein [Parasphingorhabdus sp.]